MNAKCVLKSAPVTADELLRLTTLYESEDALERRLEAIKMDRKSLETSVIERLEFGSSTPRGFQADIRTIERRYPHWRELFIERHGVAEAEKILGETIPSISKRLIVKQVA
jgi:hypothetical protein